MKKIEIGDKVQVLDDTMTGTVTMVHGDTVTMRSSDGFELEFDRSELLVETGPTSIKVSNFEVAEAKNQKDTPPKKRPAKVKAKDRTMPKMEVDLHIHQLVPSNRGMSNFDMLNIQLETAKRQLEFAIKKRIQKVVFIHGVGEGVLKEELYYLFRKYPNITHYDADYQKYGLGATEIYIYQNP
ncbi:Smr/MutS family protein [Muriicola sp.]|uniref:Smr/MutS family protein n=1 Tax=Muriicola sp. TaxID=2020856 RepID=UPI003C75651C